MKTLHQQKARAKGQRTLHWKHLLINQSTENVSLLFRLSSHFFGILQTIKIASCSSSHTISHAVSLRDQLAISTKLAQGDFQKQNKLCNKLRGFNVHYIE